ncbi:hypothetical protein OESDEN_25381, partial [Oesophagostomum dentatum]
MTNQHLTDRILTLSCLRAGSAMAWSPSCSEKCIQFTAWSALIISQHLPITTAGLIQICNQVHNLTFLNLSHNISLLFVILIYISPLKFTKSSTLPIIAQ